MPSILRRALSFTKKWTVDEEEREASIMDRLSKDVKKGMRMMNTGARLMEAGIDALERDRTKRCADLRKQLEHSAAKLAQMESDMASLATLKAEVSSRRSPSLSSLTGSSPRSTPSTTPPPTEYKSAGSSGSSSGSSVGSGSSGRASPSLPASMAPLVPPHARCGVDRFPERRRMLAPSPMLMTQPHRRVPSILDTLPNVARQ